MKWKIEYDNMVSSDDEGFWELWIVTDGEKSFNCNNEQDAKWLSEILNRADL